MTRAFGANPIITLASLRLSTTSKQLSEFVWNHIVKLDVTFFEQKKSAQALRAFTMKADQLHSLSELYVHKAHVSSLISLLGVVGTRLKAFGWVSNVSRSEHGRPDWGLPSWLKFLSPNNLEVLAILAPCGLSPLSIVPTTLLGPGKHFHALKYLLSMLTK